MDEDLLKKYIELLKSINYIQSKLSSVLEISSFLEEELQNGVIIDSVIYQKKEIEDIIKDIKNIKNNINIQVTQKIHKKININ